MAMCGWWQPFYNQTEGTGGGLWEGCEMRGGATDA